VVVVVVVVVVVMVVVVVVVVVVIVVVIAVVVFQHLTHLIQNSKKVVWDVLEQSTNSGMKVNDR
jgi:predicted PurR-regulated permease PerM